MADRLVMWFPIPDKPWSVNQDRNMSPYTRARRIKAWRTAAKEAVLSNEVELPINPESGQLEHPRGRAGNWTPGTPFILYMTIPFPIRRRRDSSNYCGSVQKAAQDGLVDAGLVPDDTSEWVGHREPTLVLGDTVVIVLEEKDG